MAQIAEPLAEGLTKRGLKGSLDRRFQDAVICLYPSPDGAKCCTDDGNGMAAFSSVLSLHKII